MELSSESVDVGLQKIPVRVKAEDPEDYYTILPKEIGRGGFGTVYKCVDNITKKEYAAKLLQPGESRSKVLSEIDIMNSLQHRCIVNLVDAFDVPPEMVLVSELVCGGELFERLVEEEEIAEVDVTFYIKQVLQAVRHIHGQGILHLDLKPENIMLVNKDSTQIKVIDFGEARRMGPDVKTMSHTLGYASPEVLNYEPVCPATDLWTIGVIAYILLYGYGPFDGETDHEVRTNTIQVNWDFEHEYVESVHQDDISKEGKDFIARLLKRKPSNRASCDECLSHPWISFYSPKKKIRTENLVSFIAKKNWKKSKAVIDTTIYLTNRLSNKRKEVLTKMRNAGKINSGKDSTTPEAPRISKQLTDCNVEHGESAIFKCRIHANPNPKITWFKDGSPIMECKQYSMFVRAGNTYVLLITDATTDIEGSFTCEAINSEGSVETSACLLVKGRQGEEDEKDGKGTSDKEKQKMEVELQMEDAWNHYKILEDLDCGTFGTTHRCIDIKTKQEYIAKCFSGNKKKSVLNEIDILNTLHHKRINTLSKAFEHSGEIVLISDNVCGGELFERLIEEEYISEMDVTFYIKQVLSAVNHMHTKGIMHLDLKPENIMLVNKNSTQIKLIDFGIASRESNNARTTYGTQYSSPELIGYDPVTQYSDMWSIGVIAYVLLSGCLPFDGDDMSEILVNVTKSEWDFNDDVFEVISDVGKDFISKLIVKEPRNRLSSKDSLQHPWLSLYSTKKTIRTDKLISFTARKNWKKSTTVLGTVNYMRHNSLKSRLLQHTHRNGINGEHKVSDENDLPLREKDDNSPPDLNTSDNVFDT